MYSTHKYLILEKFRYDWVKLWIFLIIKAYSSKYYVLEKMDFKKEQILYICSYEYIKFPFIMYLRIQVRAICQNEQKIR